MFVNVKDFGSSLSDNNLPLGKTFNTFDMIIAAA